MQIYATQRIQIAYLSMSHLYTTHWYFSGLDSFMTDGRRRLDLWGSIDALDGPVRGDAAALYAAVGNLDSAAVESILKSGADVNCTDNRHRLIWVFFRNAIVRMFPRFGLPGKEETCSLQPLHLGL